MDGRLKTGVELISLIVIIIALVLVIQYKMADMEEQTAYETNLSIYQSELKQYNAELGRYNQRIDHRAIQMLDDNKTAAEVSIININGGILIDQGLQLQDEGYRLSVRYDQLSREKEDISSPIDILIEMYQQR